MDVDTSLAIHPAPTRAEVLGPGMFPVDDFHTPDIHKENLIAPHITTGHCAETIESSLAGRVMRSGEHFRSVKTDNKCRVQLSETSDLGTIQRL